MAAIEYPVLISLDPSGACTAALVGDLESASASAPSQDEAVRQLKELLHWRVEHEAWNLDPDLSEPALTEVKVEVRPQYTIRKRIVPCPDSIWLRVPCVTGRQQGGLWLCIIPHLQVQFNFQDPAQLKSLVAHYVKEALQGLTPAQVAARMPPRGCCLDKISLRAGTGRVRQTPPSERPEMKVLFAAGDPLLAGSGSRRAASSAYGREALAESLARKLGQEKASVLLVGESGVGKSTLLLDAAKRLARAARADRGADPEDSEDTVDLRRYRFWRSSGGRMIAGMRYLGEWEERCEAFIAQLNAIEGIFCAENLLELVQAGGQGAGDSVAAFLLPYLQRGELRMASEATPQEVEACRRLLPSLLDLFQIMHVPPLNDATAVQVLHRIATAHASAARVEIEPGVPALVQRLFKRFQPYLAFPGPAAQFMRSLCDRRTALESAEPAIITAQDVIRRFTKQTGLPEVLLRDDRPLKVSEVQAQLDARIIGQPDATRAASRQIASIKAGLTDPDRPISVWLFCGPTGVGKTALAQTLVEFCFGAGGAKDRLVRLDMSEFAGWGAARRLLQNPQGGPAPWIERVRRHPFCVVLFDEIEKAAPEILDVLLGLLDEGRLTDPFGRVTWFRSAMVILTSNLGAGAPETAGFAASTGPSYATEVSRFFRPEFFNRLDDVVVFKSLGVEQVDAIARKELAELAAREGLAASGIDLIWSEPLVRAIAREGYDHRLGARPLQRAIETRISVPLARWRLANPGARGMTLRVDLDAQGNVTVI